MAAFFSNFSFAVGKITKPIGKGTKPVGNGIIPVGNGTKPVGIVPIAVLKNKNPLRSISEAERSDALPVVNDIMSLLNDTLPVVIDSETVI